MRMDYVKPNEFLKDCIDAGQAKANGGAAQLVVKGMLAGCFLGAATALANFVVAQGAPAFVGAMVFPVGFIMLVLLGLELVTGNFALLPMGAMARSVGARGIARNWTLVYLANFAGALLFAVLYWVCLTAMGNDGGGNAATVVTEVARKKTLAYQALGGAGLVVAFVKAVLCNWLVTTATVLAFSSRSSFGKVICMWIPVFLFFALQFEHAIVNMYVLPMGYFLGAGYSIADAFLWNLIPVTLGNIAGGVLLTAGGLMASHRVVSSASSSS